MAPILLMSTSHRQKPIMPLDGLPADERTALRRRIVSSGVLGRSRIYLQLFDYLMSCSEAGRSPKEIEIAIDVLGRDSSFDVTRDSVVRVYIHQLRKRLRQYYEQHEPRARLRLILPRGQYQFAVEDRQPAASSPVQARPSPGRSRIMPVVVMVLLAGVLILSLAANLWQWTSSISTTAPDAREAAQPGLPVHPLWAGMFDDDLPVLIVVGDYYIFGERDQDGRITRMIRDFDTNSAEDLSSLSAQSKSDYVDLSMSYIPEGSAAALARVAPVIEDSDKAVTVRMVSDLERGDLRNHHVIYIGYVSGLGLLEPLYFAASRLQVGQTYDELYHREARTLYSSTAARPSRQAGQRDYGLLASFPAVNNNRILILAGTRDPGLDAIARIATSRSRLTELEQMDAAPVDSTLHSRELLLQITLDNGVITAEEVIYSGAIDPTLVWSRQID